MNACLLGARTIRSRPLPALLTVLLLALGVATVIVVLLFQRALEERLGRDARGIDLVVGAKGSGLQLVLSSIFHADVPTGNIRLPELRDIALHPMVAGVIPLSLGDAYRGFRIVGTSHAYVGHYGGRLAHGRLWERPMEAVAGSRAARVTGLRAGTSFVGAHGLGGASELLHGEHPFEVVGVLRETGTVIDRLILTDSASVWEVHGTRGTMSGERAARSGAARPVAQGTTEAGVVGLHSRARGSEGAAVARSGAGAGAIGSATAEADAREAVEHARDQAHEPRANELGGAQAGSTAVRGSPDAGGPGVRRSDAASTAGVTSTAGTQSGLPTGDGEITALLVKFRTPLAAITLPRAINAGTALQAASPAAETARLFLLVGTGLDVFRAFAAILVAASALSLFVALWHAMHEQRYDLAVMRTLGATRGRILRFVLVQGAVLGVAGTVVGVGLGHSVGWIAAEWLERARSVSVGTLGWAPEEGLVAAGAVLIALAAAAVPAARAWRLDVVTILAERR